MTWRSPAERLRRAACSGLPRLEWSRRRSTAPAIRQVLAQALVANCRRAGSLRQRAGRPRRVASERRADDLCIAPRTWLQRRGYSRVSVNLREWSPAPRRSHPPRLRGFFAGRWCGEQVSSVSGSARQHAGATRPTVDVQSVPRLFATFSSRQCRNTAYQGKTNACCYLTSWEVPVKRVARQLSERPTAQLSIRPPPNEFLPPPGEVISRT